jgi:hypothetical protein
MDNSKSKIVNPAFLWLGDLKKQSQFAPARIGAKSLVKGDYGNKPACGAEKYKPNSKPIRQTASMEC